MKLERKYRKKCDNYVALKWGYFITREIYELILRHKCRTEMYIFVSSELNVLNCDMNVAVLLTILYSMFF